MQSLSTRIESTTERIDSKGLHQFYFWVRCRGSTAGDKCCTYATMPSNQLGTAKGPKTAVSESVHGFLTGLTYGAIWGLVSPFPYTQGKPGGAFRPAPPFSSIRGVWFNAAIFGPLFGVTSFFRSGMALMRGTDDLLNDVFGLGVAAGYYNNFLANEKRLILHNRAVGAVLLGGVLYANVVV